MDPSLYKAAMEGKVDILMQYNNIDQLDVQLTSNGNTVLHVAAQFGQLECVKQILGKHPFLLREVNSKGETPLHIAASEGQSGIVQELIDCAKILDQEIESGGGTVKELMLRATNHEEKDTALHMAVQNPHCNLEVVRLLTSEDPEFQHPPNNAEETPLYLAAERGYVDVVSEILETCTSPTYGGPAGRTALHAAAVSDVTGQCTKILLNSDLIKVHNQDLVKVPDAYGWTPLRYAAHCGFEKAVREILARDQTARYLTADKDDKNTALHIAAAKGHVSVMEELLSQCPDSWELVNSKGQNILHIAVEMEEKGVIKFILEKSWISQLINQKDIEGKTPLHLLATSESQMPELMLHRSADWRALKFTDLNHEVVMSTEEEMQKEVESDIDNMISIGRTAGTENKKQDDTKIRETQLVVAALIATVTFAAGFTLPGGYDGNAGPYQGMAVLFRKAAFKAFVVTNAIALTYSISAVFIHLSLSITKTQNLRFFNHDVAAQLILTAILAMMVAFITGTYAALPNSSGLATAMCVIGSPFFAIYYSLVINLSLLLLEEIKKMITTLLLIFHP